MRIGILMLSAPPKRNVGAEKYDLELAHSLIEADVDVNVYLIEENDSWEYEGIKINPPIQDCDILITHCDLLKEAKQWKEKLNTNHTIGIVHNLAVQTLRQEKDSFWDTIIYNSEYLKSISNNKEAEKLVLYPPVNHKVSKTLSKGNKILLVNLSIPKGVSEFFNLALRNPDLEFLGVEGGWGTQETKIGSLNNIEIIQHTNDMASVFKQARVLLFPSNSYESWGMVATEAMAYGIPTITYDNLYGPRENIGSTGSVVARNDLYTMGKLIRTLKPSKSVQTRFKEVKEITNKQLLEVRDYIKRLEKK